jgi:hypothetical protein
VQFERNAQFAGAAVNADFQGSLYGHNTQRQLKETEKISRNKIFRGICFNCLAPRHRRH